MKIDLIKTKTVITRLPFLAALLIIWSLIAVPVSAQDDFTGPTPTEEIGDLITIILTLAFIVGGFVLTMIILSLILFRDKSKRKRKTPSTGNKRLEIIWTIIPALIISYLAFISGQALMVVKEPPEEALRIEVIGHQWFWEFRYPDGNVSFNKLWLEEGQVVVFELTSEDIIHSFSIPDFYQKIDVFPNKKTEAWIKAEPAGTHRIFCAEFCGSGHHGMLGEMVIFEPEEGRKPYGPPEGYVDTSDIDSGPETIVDVQLLESGGPSDEQPWSISPSKLDFLHHQNVSLRIWNDGAVLHNFSIGEPYNLEIKSISPGTFEWLNFTADVMTTDTIFLCAVPGHDIAGMTGTFNVHHPDDIEDEPSLVHETPKSENRELYRALSVGIIVVVVLTILAAFRPVKEIKTSDDSEEAESESEADKSDKKEAGNGK